MSFLSSNKNITIISFHDTDIRVIKMGGRKEVFFAESFPIKPNIIKKDSVLDKNEISKILKDIFAKNKVLTREVAFVIPSRFCFIHIFKISKEIKYEDARQNILNEVKTLIPFDQDSVYFNIFGASNNLPDSPTNIYTYFGIPLSDIQIYQNIFHDAGLELEMIDIESRAKSRALISLPKDFSEHESVATLSIGDEISNIDIFNKNKDIILSSIAPFSGGLFTKDIAMAVLKNENKEPGLSENSVIQDKQVIFDLKPESSVLQIALKTIGEEILRSSKHVSDIFLFKLNLIILSGELSLIPDIAKHISSMVGISTMVGDPTKEIKYKNGVIKENQKLLFDLCIGLGLIYFKTEDRIINLNDKRFKKDEKKEDKKSTEKQIITKEEKPKRSGIKIFLSALFILLTIGFLGYVTYKYILAPLGIT